MPPRKLSAAFFFIYSLLAFPCYHLSYRRGEGLGFGLVGFRESAVHLVAVVVFRSRLQVVHQHAKVRPVKVGIKGMGIGKVIPLSHLHLDAVDPAVVGIHARDGDGGRGILEVFPFEGDGLDVGVFILLAGEGQYGQGDGQGRDA